MACQCTGDDLHRLVGGLGTSVEWNQDLTVHVDLQLADSPTIGHTITQGTGTSEVKISRSSCDERLVKTASGLSAGSKQYSTIGATLATKGSAFPTPSLVVDGSVIGAPIANGIILSKAIYLVNKSACLPMPVMWSHQHRLPVVSAEPGFSAWIEVQERLLGTGEPTTEGIWSTVDRIYYINDTESTKVIAYPSVSYFASGTLLPNATLQVDSRINITAVAGNATYQEAIRGRSDALGVNTSS